MKHNSSFGPFTTVLLITLALLLGRAQPVTAQSSTPLSVGKTVLGNSPSIYNVLKSIKLAHDSSTNELYVAGTLTGHVGVVTPGAGVKRTWRIRGDHYDVMGAVLNEASGQLWHVSKKGKMIYVSDPYASSSNLLAQYPIKNEVHGLWSSLPDYPVHNAAVDTNTGNIWFTSATTSTGGQTALLGYGVSWTSSGYAITNRAIFTAMLGANDMKWAPSWRCTAASSTLGAMVMLHRDRPASGPHHWYLAFYDLSSGTPVYDKFVDLTASYGITDVSQLDVAANNDIYLAGAGRLVRLQYGAGARSWKVAWDVTLSRNNGAAEMKVNPDSGQVALLYKRDNNYLHTGAISSPLALPYLSWVDTFDSNGSFIAAWDAGYESESLVAVTATAEDDYQFAVGSGGKAQVVYIPSAASGAVKRVGVGTSSEFLLLPEADPNKVFALSRLGGSKLAVLPTSGAVGTYHNKDVIGPWPCGMAQSKAGRYLYVLSHYDNSFRVLDAGRLASATTNNDTGAVRTTIKLPGRHISSASGGYTLDYQLTDSLSAMASSADGKVHLAMLSELGSIHVVETSGTSAAVAYSKNLIDMREDYGAGRLQAAVGSCGGDQSSYVAFVLHQEEKNDDLGQRTIRNLHRLDNSSGSWVYRGSVKIPATATISADAADSYKRASLLFNENDCTVSVYNLLYRATTATPSFVRYLHQTDSSDPNANLALMRVVAAPGSSRLFGQYFNGANEILREVSYTTSGTPRYTVSASYTLFTGDTMKSGTAMRDNGSSWDGAFSEAHLGRIHYKTGL